MPPSEYWHPVWDEKTRIVSLPDGEKNFEDMFICSDVIHERDRRTLHHSKDRAYASHRAAKNWHQMQANKTHEGLLFIYSMSCSVTRHRIYKQ